MDFIFTWIQSIFSFDWEAFLALAGSSPFAAMMYLIARGGWIVLLWVFLWGFREIWLDYKQGQAAAKKEWTLLMIRAPSTSEQSVRAMENAFASFAGAHSPASWTEKWMQGKTQSAISLEIVSLEGHVGYYIRCERPMRDLIEAALYAQYPDAEIQEVEDYTKKVPGHYPDEEWDLWGTEMVPVQKSDAYPLKTYIDFKDETAEDARFKDPLAALLENFSRLGPGEQAWYQIIIVPTDQKDERKRAEALIKKIKGEKEAPKRSLLDEIIDLPLSLVNTAFSTGAAPPKKEGAATPPKILLLSPVEKQILEAVERKASKIGFLSKVRFIYVAKKVAMKKAKVVQPFIGAIKQTNTFHMQALKPEGKHVGVNGTLWWFKDKRNNTRKHHLMVNYRGRSATRGMPPFFLGSEELATLWHFPVLMQVRAPQLERTTSKKAEPPSNIPFV
jgi:hypothetical protein